MMILCKNVDSHSYPSVDTNVTPDGLWKSRENLGTHTTRIPKVSFLHHRLVHTSVA